MANTIVVTVGDPDTILQSEMYDAGAIIRLQSCATVDGTYANEATATVVSGTMSYPLYDADGSSTTWYQTRFENLLGTVTSEWEGPFQAPADDLYLSVDQFRLFSSTSLTDEALTVLLRAAQQAIIAEVGYAGPTTEWLRAGRGPLLMLSRPAVAVTGVVEDDLALADDDYVLSASGLVVRRLDTGTNASSSWTGRVDVTYLPRDDFAERQRVVRELVTLDLTYQPGLAAQTIGTWSETYQGGATYAEQRAAILASLHGEAVIV